MFSWLLGDLGEKLKNMVEQMEEDDKKETVESVPDIIVRMGYEV